MNKIYADIQSLVKNKKNYIASKISDWPINEIKFKKFYTDVLSNYENLIKTKKKTTGELLLSDFKFLMNLIDYVHYFSVFLKSKENLIKVVNFKKVISKQRNKLFANIHDQKKYQENHSILKIKKMLKNYLYANNNKRKVLVFGSKTKNLERFIKRKQERPIYNYQQLFFSKKNLNKKTKKIFIKNIDYFFLKVEKSAKNYFKVNIDLKDIKFDWIKKISKLNDDYLYVVNSPYIKSFSKIYFTDDVQVNHRLISSAAQSIGVDTYKFDHGNNSYFKENKLNKFFLSNYKYHVCENKNSFELLKKIYKNNKDFLGSSNILFQNIPFKKKIKKNLNKNIKKIMLMGFPMTTNRYMGSEDLFWYNEFLLELEILKSLKKKGYKILYKIHPSVIGWEHIFKEYVDEIIYENFEKCWQKADLLIFSHIGSTTFAYSLSTNIPVILFDNKKNANWNKGVYKYIEKRCSLINHKRNNLYSKFNKKNFVYEITKIKRVKNNLILDNLLKFK